MRRAATKRSETFFLFENYKPAERACQQFAHAPSHVGRKMPPGQQQAELNFGSYVLAHYPSEDKDRPCKPRCT
jgi:hypothetical protein